MDIMGNETQDDNNEIRSAFLMPSILSCDSTRTFEGNNDA
jgi:hypothetical protein